MPKPLLSIGIIFRDDIRCLERCLSSLDPLRKAIPCELVMADTGSVDGSREIAEKYADVVFDFPWVNDFSAARNAVLDRCTGRWYLTIDTDEWLDSDIKELVSFLRANSRKTEQEAGKVFQRNYVVEDDETDYRDFIATRLLRISSGARYYGAIHESFEHDDRRPIVTCFLYKTILHHDGYIGLSTEKGEQKRKRNMDLLTRKLEKDPENIRLLLQCIESNGMDGEEVEKYIRRGIAAVEAKGREWNWLGPAIFRYAVIWAERQKLDEQLEWANRAEELFPESLFTLIDIYFKMFHYHWAKKDYDECIRLGEGYLYAIADYRSGRGVRNTLNASTLIFASPGPEQWLRTLLAHAYFQAGQPERAVKMQNMVDFSLINEDQTQNSILLLRDLYKDTEIDTAPLLQRLYKGICKPTPNEKRAEERKKAFSDVGSSLFSSMEEEEKSENFTRWSCTMFAPLAGQHELGDAVAVLMAETVQKKEQLLAATDKPYAMPREVLRRAILSGISFPLRDKPLSMEEMESMAYQLAREDGLGILKLAVDRMDDGFQQLAWAESVALAIVSAWEWVDNEQSMELARTFVRVEEAFLPRCYAPEVLCEDNILIMPSMHQLGWYCGKAFQALDSGDTTGYVQMLRAGLKRCPKMKAMVEYLAQYTPQTQNPSRELLELAEKVRTLLAAYDPEDPAVVALKQSPVYQKVAHLIEKSR